MESIVEKGRRGETGEGQEGVKERGGSGVRWEEKKG